MSLRDFPPLERVIAIDGPVGSGKGTVSRKVAERLGWHRLDSGALYRLVALAAERQGVALDDGAALGALAQAMQIAFAVYAGEEQVWLEGQDVTAPLRTERCGEGASQVARHEPVRAALLERQRAMARPPGLVADGRDMGTVVFPRAALKVFLTASPEERVRRRHKQLKEKGISVSLPGLSREIAQRDLRDANRPVAPLRPADDARVLDSSRLSPDEVVDRIVSWAQLLGIVPSRGD